MTVGPDDDTKQLPFGVALTISQDADATEVQAKALSGVSVTLRIPTNSRIEDVNVLFDHFPQYLDTATKYLLDTNNNMRG